MGRQRKKRPIQIHPDLEGRFMPPEMEAALRRSLIEVGQLHPILVTDDNYIIEGSVRWRLLLEIHGPDCPVDFINVGCHSGIGKLPKTLAYKHSTIEDEYETTQERLKALRPWSWSRWAEPTSLEPKLAAPTSLCEKYQRFELRRSLILDWLKTNGPATNTEIMRYMHSQGHQLNRHFVPQLKRTNVLRRTGETKANPGGGRRVDLLEPTPT